MLRLPATLCGAVLLVLSAEAAPATYPFDIGRNGEITGQGASVLRPEIARAQFVLYGQDEGYADAAVVLRAIAHTARPFGFHTLAIEAGPLTTKLAVRAIRDQGLPAATAVMRRAPLATIMTLNTQEELTLVADFAEADRSSLPTVWGIDEEGVGSSLLLLEQLQTLAPGKAARDAVNRLIAEERDPNKPFLTLSADDAVFRNLADLFPGIAPAQRIITALRETTAWYRLRKTGHFTEGEARRAALLRANFLRFYRGAGGEPKVITIMGGNHLGFGETPNATFDIGTLATAIAEIDGQSALRILFFPAGGTPLDNKMRKSHPYYLEQYDDSDPASFYAAIGIDPKSLALHGWTLIPLAPIRARLMASGIDKVSAQTRFFVLGYDYLITTPDAKPATPIQ